MNEPKAIVLRAAGTNCDRETEFALARAGFEAERIHAYRLMENPSRLGDYHLLVIPGGFSYGDDVAAGKILANQLRHRLGDALNEFIAAGKLILGICNGFQVMLKSGLLPWGRVSPQETNTDATLAWNDSGKFEDRWVHLRCDSDRCAFIRKDELIALPVAHGEGKFVTKDEATATALRDGGQVVLRYTDPSGRPGPYPINPNGSIDGVAGICDPTGRIFALMPHPERFADVTHHPQWTRGKPDRADGMVIFENAFEYFETGAISQ